MVTFGPLIFLALLAVTFHIGANSVRPAATIEPITRPDHSRSESDTSTIPAMKTPTSGAVLPTRRTSDASEGTFQAVEPPCSGPRVQRGRSWGTSEDNIAVSHSEGPTERVSGLTGPDNAARRKRESPGTNKPSSSLNDVSVSRHDNPMVHTIKNSGVELESNPSTSGGPVEGSLRISRWQSFRSVWKAGPPKLVADPQQVKPIFRS